MKGDGINFSNTLRVITSIKIVETMPMADTCLILSEHDRGFQHIPTQRTVVWSLPCHCSADALGQLRSNAISALFGMSDVIITPNGSFWRSGVGTTIITSTISVYYKSWLFFSKIRHSRQCL